MPPRIPRTLFAGPSGSTGVDGGEPHGFGPSPRLLPPYEGERVSTASAVSGRVSCEPTFHSATCRRTGAASGRLGSDNRKGPPSAKPQDGIGTWVGDGSSVRGTPPRAEPRHPQRPSRTRTGDSQSPSDSPTATACAEIANGGGDTHYPSSRRCDHGSTYGATNNNGTINGEFTGQGNNGHSASQGSIIRFCRDGSTPPRVQSRARGSIANPLRGKDPFVNALLESEKEEPNRYHIMLEEDVVGDTVRNRHAELQHHMQGHVPYMAGCTNSCVTSLSLVRPNGLEHAICRWRGCSVNDFGCAVSCLSSFGGGYAPKQMWPGHPLSVEVPTMFVKDLCLKKPSAKCGGVEDRS